jgi:hypothetical protein
MAYVLDCTLRRIGLHGTDFATATCGTIRLKLLKIGAIVRVSVRLIRAFLTLLMARVIGKPIFLVAQREPRRFVAPNGAACGSCFSGLRGPVGCAAQW